MSRPIFRFQEMRREKGISSRAIAECAHIPLRVEYLYEIGALVDPETQDKILAAFCQLTGTSYTVSDVEGEQSDDQQPTLVLPILPKRGFPQYIAGRPTKESR